MNAGTLPEGETIFTRVDDHFESAKFPRQYTRVRWVSIAVNTYYLHVTYRIFTKENSDEKISFYSRISRNVLWYFFLCIY